MSRHQHLVGPRIEQPAARSEPSVRHVRVDFSELRPDNTIVARGTARANDEILTVDASGNSCLGTVEKVDERTRLLWIRVNRSTWHSAVYA